MERELACVLLEMIAALARRGGMHVERPVEVSGAGRCPDPAPALPDRRRNASASVLGAHFYIMQGNNLKDTPKTALGFKCAE